MLQARLRGTEQVEIVDEHGVSVGEVIRPTDPRPLGLAKGTVYLKRTPLPAARELPPAA